MAIYYSSTDPKMKNFPNREEIGNQILGVLKKSYRGKTLKNTIALDIGCSNGIITHLLADSVGQITGIDVDIPAIKFAKRNFKKNNLKFKVMDGTRMNFPKNHFDIVICNQVHFYVKDSNLLISEIHRILKPKGVCFLSSGHSIYQKCLQNFTLQKSQIKNVRSLSQLRELCHNFNIHDYTLKILNDPEKYGYRKLKKYQPIFKFLPIKFWEKVEFLLPNTIWILEKV